MSCGAAPGRHTFISGDIRSAVATGLEAAGDKKLEGFGTDVATQCLNYGLVDEILLHVALVLLGDGVPLFARRDAAPIPLEAISSTQAGGLTHLRFRVRG